MNEIIKNIEAAQLKAEVPAFNTGDTVRVHALIKEGNRERVQVFEGTVLKKQGGSNSSAFRYWVPPLRLAAIRFSTYILSKRL